MARILLFGGTYLAGVAYWRVRDAIPSAISTVWRRWLRQGVKNASEMRQAMWVALLVLIEWKVGGTYLAQGWRAGAVRGSIPSAISTVW